MIEEIETTLKEIQKLQLEFRYKIFLEYGIWPQPEEVITTIESTLEEYKFIVKMKYNPFGG